MSGGRRFSEKRLVDLVIHLLAKHGQMNPMKLLLLLYHIDAAAYGTTGKSITGDTYYKAGWGPCGVNAAAFVTGKKKGRHWHKYFKFTPAKSRRRRKP